MPLMEKRIQHAKLEPGQTFTFPFCSVMEFKVVPEVGSEDFEYDFLQYGQVQRHKNVGIGFSGDKNPIFSCPDETDSQGNSLALGITAVVGNIIVYYFM